MADTTMPYGAATDRHIVNTPQMIIGMHLGNGYGSLPGAWRMPWVDPASYTDYDTRVRTMKKSGKWYSKLAQEFPKGNHASSDRAEAAE